MRLKNKKYLNIFICFFILTISIMLLSCSAPSSSDNTRIDVSEEEPIIDDEMVRAAEEATPVEDLTDYDNVNVSAEFRGAIPNFLCVDKENYIKIEVTNTSDFTWRKDGPHSVRIGYHFFGQDVDFSEYDKTTRTSLLEDLQPNETTEVLVLVDNIDQVGTYILQIDIVLEAKYWFSSKGVPMIEGPVYFGQCSN